mmetsp:Transcript_1683/g.3980  ORF Transcript_1683/g.3980 Transcript_1683/m.3980 type:complete len:353 (-) Transcript_1683:59-1117(-)
MPREAAHFDIDAAGLQDMDLGATAESRELLLNDISQSQSRSRSSHTAVHMSKVAFLAFHAVALWVATIKLEDTDMSWWPAFAFAFMGDAAALGCLVASWFVSCPYVKLCLQERQPKVGVDCPSILTDIFPEIILAFFGALFMIFIFVTEFLVFSHLTADGGTSKVVGVNACLAIIGLVCIIHAVLLRPQAALFGFVGLDIWVTLVVVHGTRDDSSLVYWRFVPTAAALLLFVVTLAAQMRSAAAVLRRPEKVLRSLEVLALCIAEVGFCFLTRAVKEADTFGPWSAADSTSIKGCASWGFLVCVGLLGVAAIRARLYCWELEFKPVSFRQLQTVAANAAASPRQRGSRTLAG